MQRMIGFLMMVGLLGGVGCGDDESSPTSSSVQSPPYTMLVVSDDEQRMIDENLALITEFYTDNSSDHFLILVGDGESLIEDMSCNSHDQAVVDRMLGGGTPRFLHLAPTEELSEENAGVVDEAGRALNQKYLEAPQNIKDAIDYVNQFAGHEGALNDDSTFLFNYSSADGAIYNGKCQDLGNHHLGLFKNTKVVTEMNNANYGTSTWNGVPIYGNLLLVDVTIGGINWKLKLDSGNGKFFIRKNSSTNYCKDWVYDSNSLKDFLACSVVYIASSYISDSF
jgi:hypothetical protein